MTVTREQVLAVLANANAVAADLKAMADSLVVVPVPEPEPTPEPIPGAGFIWAAPDGDISAFRSLQQEGTGNTVKSATIDGQRWIVCDAPTGRATANDAAKAGVEQKGLFTVKRGEVIRMSAIQEWEPASTYNNVFTADFEREAGTRLRMNADGTPRLDGGKLGFPSRNADRGGKISIATLEPTLITYECLAHTSAGYMKIYLNDEEVAAWLNVETMNGDFIKAQFGITANASGRAQRMRFRQFKIEVR